VDAILFQDLGGADAFPGRGDLDQHALARHAGLFVQVDDLAGLGQQSLFVKGQACIHFGGNTARDGFENAGAHGDREGVRGQADVTVAVADGLLQQVLVTVQGSCLEQQRRVGGGVDRLEFGDGIEVAGVGDNGGHLLELFQLGSHVRALSFANG